jgi:mannosyltransferase
MAAAIRRQQQLGDDVSFEKGRTMRAGIDFYLRHDSGRPQDVLLRKTAAETATLTASEYTDPVTRLVAKGRIWPVVFGRRADPVTGRRDLAAFLRNQFRRAGVWPVARGTLALSIRRP